MTHPTDSPRRITRDQAEGRHVLGHDRPGGNEAVLAELVPADNRRIGSDRRAASHHGRAELSLALNLSSRGKNIGCLLYTSDAADD